MALQVWLPLNNDFSNVGLDGRLSATTLGTVSVIDGGPIGKCLSAGVASQTQNGLRYGTNLIEELGRHFSVAVWVKPNGTHVHYNGTIISSGNWNTPNGRWAFGVSQDNTQVDAFGPNYNQWVSCEVPVGEWTHLASVFDDGIGKVYKNGEYVGQRDFGSLIFSSDTTNFCVGRETYAGGYFSFNGNISDLRIYDHCLSAKEIKEISKGLVLHYKFNELYGLTNLVGERNTYTVYNNYGTGMTYTKEVLSETYRGFPVERWTYTIVNDSCASGFKSGYYSRGIHTGTYVYLGEQNTTIPFVYWIYYRPQTSGLTAGGTASNIGGWTAKPREYMGDGWWRVGQYRTGNTHATRVQDLIYTSLNWPYAGVGSSCTIDFAVDYCLSGTTAIFEDFEEGNTIVHDYSGYGNNGTIGNQLTAFDESPRYNRATSFASSAYVRAGRGGMIKEALTISLWAHHTSWTSAGRMFSCTESGGWNMESNGGYLRLSLNAGGYALATDTLPLASYTSGWHHFAGTFDGKNKKICFYRDGEFIASATTSSSAITYHSSNGVFIGAEAGANQTTPAGTYFNGAISDFRIYGATLSPEDIAELYHTPASVDNKGNLFCYELNEI